MQLALIIAILFLSVVEAVSFCGWFLKEKKATQRDRANIDALVSLRDTIAYQGKESKKLIEFANSNLAETISKALGPIFDQPVPVGASRVYGAILHNSIDGSERIHMAPANTVDEFVSAGMTLLGPNWSAKFI